MADPKPFAFADQAAADKKHADELAAANKAAHEAHGFTRDNPLKEAPEVVAPKKAAVALTSDDKFILVDDNHDGIPDRIEVVHPDKEAEAKAAEAAKFAPFHKAVTAARNAAEAAATGKSAKEVLAAGNAAAAKAEAEWKGPKPHPDPTAEKAKVEAEKQKAADEAAFQAELSKLG